MIRGQRNLGVGGRLWLLTLFLGLAAATADAQERPPYPHVNMSICYEVDPNWPQRPAGAEWGSMSGVTVDALDQVWLFTRAVPPVQVFTAEGKFVRSWGNDHINRAHMLRFDPQGNAWTTDVRLHVARQFTPEGKLLRTLGTPEVAGEDATHLNKPTDVAVTRAGEIFVADGYGNNRIVHFDKNGRFVKAWGKLGVKPGEFSLPHSLAIDSKERLYVADRNNARVQVFNTDGKFLTEWRNLLVPWVITITKNDEIWISGSSPMPWREKDAVLSCPPKDQLVMRFDADGRVQQLWTLPRGQEGTSVPGEVDWLHGIGVDSQGNLYVGDIMGKRAQKLVRRTP